MTDDANHDRHRELERMIRNLLTAPARDFAGHIHQRGDQEGGDVVRGHAKLICETV